MRGQWLGSYTGATNGAVTVELDDYGDRYEGMAYYYPSVAGLPAVGGRVITVEKNPIFSLTVDVMPIDRSNGTFVSWDSVKQNYPGVTLDSKLVTQWSFDLKRSTLLIESNSDSAGVGTAHLSRNDASKPSDRKPLSTVRNWTAFKDYALSLDPARYVFRGQESNGWRLRTYFHRLGRADLARFVNQDVPQLHANLSSLTQHHFNIHDNVEYAAFCSLVQHHGYPTPLLDWTRSPFIAAYFSFRKRLHSSGYARIFIFDVREWMKDVPRSHLISAGLPHFSLLNAVAINNPRMVPQQALSTVANVDDIEEFISFMELKNKKTYLEVIDLPLSERPQIVQELSLMGITAGSIFPGLDGACEQLRERNF